MKKILLSLCLLIPNVAFGVAAEPISYSSVTFHSVNYSSGTSTLIHFQDVIVQERPFNVSVSVDHVVVFLKENFANYTTLNLIDVSDSLVSYKWLQAERAIVVVRSKSDLLAWEKFLSHLTARQELERKKRLEPRRVLPPKL